MIVFPDAEAAVVSAINTALTAAGDAARAATRVPVPRPSRFVRVIRTGGRVFSPAHEDAQVTVECWAPDGPAASLLARTVHAIVRDLDAASPVAYYLTDVGGPASLPDPDTGTPRYVFTSIVRLRAS